MGSRSFLHLRPSPTRISPSYVCEVESSCSRRGPRRLRPGIRSSDAASDGLELDLRLEVSAAGAGPVGWAGSVEGTEKEGKTKATLGSLQRGPPGAYQLERIGWTGFPA